MIILAIKTDQQEAELWLFEDNQQLAHRKWQAHKQLAESLNSEIDKISASGGSSKSLKDIEGVACFKGPGSFTGLRIGLSVANTIAYANSVPIAARSGDDWLKTSIQDLLDGQSDKLALPKYGRPATTTRPKK